VEAQEEEPMLLPLLHHLQVPAHPLPLLPLHRPLRLPLPEQFRGAIRTIKIANLPFEAVFEHP
jgi:hypothetical protein